MPMQYLQWSAASKSASLVTHLEHDWDSPVWLTSVDGTVAPDTLIRFDSAGNGLSDREPSDISFAAFLRIWKRSPMQRN